MRLRRDAWLSRGASYSRAMSFARVALALVSSAVLLGASAPQRLVYPPAPPRPVTDSYFGREVVDPYRWLEDASSAETRAWAAAESNVATRFIQAQPGYAALRARVETLAKGAPSRSGLQIARGRWVYLRRTPPAPQAVLVARDGAEGQERVLFDPSASATGAPPAIASVFLSPDGSRVAFSTQDGGSEHETLHVVEVVSRTMLSDTLPNVGGGTTPTALAWDADGKGFTHTALPRNADGTFARNGIVLVHHVLGDDPANDAYVFGRGLSPKAEYHLVGAPDGSARASVPIPGVTSIDELAADPAGGDVIVGYQNYTTPSRWYRYDAAHNALVATAIGQAAPGDFSRVRVQRVLVPSLDGKVQIPLEIVSGPGTRGARTPTILGAYGAYGSITRPRFSATNLAWLERGGAIASAMIRGGGEYGEDWHQGAHFATKTNSADDLAACAKWLGANGYGDNKHLGIAGGSAGGFLMGLALTRNPELYRAVVSSVGFYDLLRVELTPNGAFNTPEFGTVTDPAQFPWMLEQSPYHNVRKGVAYPAVLMTTGENDPRVDPYNSRKMIAELQADSSSPYPILLLQKSGQGHGIGNSFQQTVDAAAERFAFFWSQLSN